MSVISTSNMNGFNTNTEVLPALRLFIERNCVMVVTDQDDDGYMEGFVYREFSDENMYKAERLVDHFDDNLVEGYEFCVQFYGLRMLPMLVEVRNPNFEEG